MFRKVWKLCLLLSCVIHLFSMLRYVFRPQKGCQKTQTYLWLPERVKERHVDDKFLLIPGITKTDAFAHSLGAKREETVVKEPVPVLILSYMRAGSSFFGNVLFGINPNVFYFHEPLASLYASMYGVPGLWATETDIVTNSNGTERALPEWELNSVVWMLSKIFSCELDSFPTHLYTDETVAFRRWSSKLYNFRSCLSKTPHISKANVSECWSSLQGICGSRFGAVSKRQQEFCLNTLWGETYKKIQQPYTPTAFESSGFGGAKLDTFKQCIAQMMPYIRKCVPLLQESCSPASARAVKTVRATMGAVGRLFEKIPNLHVLHLHRDPRNVVGSRKRHSWAQGLYDKGNVTALARAYCQRLHSDSLVRRTLVKKHKGKILPVKFDEFLKDVVSHSAFIYKWLGLGTTQVREDYIRVLAKDSKSYIQKWQTDLTPEEASHVLEVCRGHL